MPEGVAVSGGAVIADATFDDPKKAPAPDAEKAPRGWTWDRSERRWRPKNKPGNYSRQGSGGGAASPAPGERAGGPQDGSPETDRVARDPDPAWFGQEAAPASRSQGRQLSFDDVPQQVKDDIAGLAGLIGAPVLSMLQAADPYCGTALAQAFEPIVDATLPLICRSEKIIAYFRDDKSDWLLWGKLAMALAPVARAVYDHHVRRSVLVVKDPQTGQVQFMARNAGTPEHGDHLVPPGPAEFNYAA